MTAFSDSIDPAEAQKELKRLKNDVRIKDKLIEDQEREITYLRSQLSQVKRQRGFSS